MSPDKNAPPGSGASQAVDLAPRGAEGTRTQPTPKKRKGAKSRAGLSFTRYYSTEGVHPYDAVEWERRDAVIEIGRASCRERV